jgi:hypothetical protein
MKFFGSVFEITNIEKEQISHISREELARDRVDLTHCPVVMIGGKSKWHIPRVRSFISENPGFRGAFLLLPGTGNWDLDSGDLLLTSRSLLRGERVSGGKPEVKLHNFRFLLDGRYVADRCKMLHSKVLETIESELEQDAEPQALAKQLMNNCYAGPNGHPLGRHMHDVAEDLVRLESRRIFHVLSGGRNMKELVAQNVTEKLKAAGVRRVGEIPAGITVTAEEIAPDLLASRDTLGTVEVPGLGRLEAQWDACANQRRGVPVVKVSADDVVKITDWPHTNIGLWVPELGYSMQELESGNLADLLFQPGQGRWPKILVWFNERWVKAQRDKNYPKPIDLPHPLEAEPPARPCPTVWARNLVSGQEYKAYAALVHLVFSGRGRVLDQGWKILWFENAEEAEKRDAEARLEAESFAYTRKLEAEVAAGVAPIPVPKYKEPEWDKELSSEQYRERVAAEERKFAAEAAAFVSSISVDPAFFCLPTKRQEELRERAVSQYGSGLVDLEFGWPLARKLYQLQSEGKILVNWGGAFRVMGATSNRQLWVVRPDGTLRPSTSISYRKDYLEEGGKEWRLVGAEELALVWEKENTAAPHQFTVAHMPLAGVTDQQVAASVRLEQEIAERWSDIRGIAGSRSPRIGRGWGLAKK